MCHFISCVTSIFGYLGDQFCQVEMIELESVLSNLIWMLFDISLESSSCLSLVDHIEELTVLLRLLLSN